jgi:ATP-dependent DNA helicase UvrD/PcrA
MIKLSADQQTVMSTAGPLLVVGGPGSGKTTVSILKAGVIARDELKPYQRILFLSFARATVARVIEAIDEAQSLSPDERKLIEIDTYHALFWKIICTHGYLAGLPRSVNLLTPQAEAVALSAIRHDFGPDNKLNDDEQAAKNAAEAEEHRRLAIAEGNVCFDLFAPLVADLFERSHKIRTWFATRYPVIIVDEFQDTNADQWRVVKAMHNDALVIALADAEQRIFDFIGADPERLEHFKGAFTPTVIDLKGANHRSGGTDIAFFGNEVLAGRFTKSSYNGVEVRTFPGNKNQAYAELVSVVLKARARLVKSKKRNWSLAVLAPTKQMARTICDVFAQPMGKLPAIAHTAAVDVSGIMLAAELVAFAMEPVTPGRDSRFMELLVRFYRGKNGDKPSGGDLKSADALEAAMAKYKAKLAEGKAPSAASVSAKALSVLHAIDAAPRSGDVRKDWVTTRDAFADGASNQLKAVAEEVRNLRLLNRGSDLRESLGDLWRVHGAYVEALDAVRAAFVKDHFASASKPDAGVIVMNMHKSKGKQFDEVVIFEGWPAIKNGEILANSNRIAWGNDAGADNQQARQMLRVAVTRAKSRTTIMTPGNDPCVLLLG